MSSLPFGVVVTVVTLMRILTPPVGVSPYVTTDIAGTRVRRVWVAVLPFLIPIGVLLGLVTAFPELTEWLPAQRFSTDHDARVRRVVVRQQCLHR